jgi:hypothetical protein
MIKIKTGSGREIVGKLFLNTDFGGHVLQFYN